MNDTTTAPATVLATEQSFIGACMMCQGEVVAYGLTANMQPEWFRDWRAAGMWRWILSRFRAGKTYGFPEACDVSKTPEDVQWLEKAVDNSSTAYSAQGQISDIRNAWMKRQGDLLLRQSMTALAEAEEPESTVCSIAKNLLDLAAEQGEDLPIAEVALKQYEKWKDRKPSAHLYWPIQKMQQVYGFIENDLICLLASPSCGKTAFALQSAVTWAKASHRVAYKSLESKKAQLSGRLIAHLGNVNVSRVRKNVATDEEQEQYLAACETLKKLPIDVDDKPADLAGVFAWAVMAKQRGAGMLILDNLKHIRVGNSKKDTVEQFRELFLGCKRIRDDVDLPFMILHHTNTEGEAAWSRDIERDADIMLHMNVTSESNKGDPVDEYIGIGFEFRKYREDASGLIIETEFKRRIQTFVEA